MRRGNKPDKTVPGQPKASASPAEPAPAEAARGAKPAGASHRLARDAVIGAALIIVAVGIGLWTADSRFSQQVSLSTYDGIQSILQAKECPVVIVDITNLNSVRWADGRMLTDRKTLGEVVSLIARQRPAAIGVDIDFSPNYNPLAPGSPPTYHAPGREDPDFFDACLSSRRDGVPVYLGAYRSSKRPRGEVLVEPRYADLAADIRTDVADNRLVPASFRWQAEGQEIPSLSAATAQAYRTEQAAAPSWLRWALHSEVDTPVGSGGRAREIYVDFSAIDTLVQERVNFIDLSGTIDHAAFENIRGRLSGRIVLLGSADMDNPKEGCFTVPGRRIAYPGVYLHGTAAYTQARSPLMSLSRNGRIAVDVVLSVIVLATVCLLRWWLIHSRRPNAERWRDRLPWVITVVVMSGTFVVGVLFVNYTRVVWDDFVLVFLAMGLHVPVESQVEKLAHARSEPPHDPKPS